MSTFEDDEVIDPRLMECMVESLPQRPLVEHHKHRLFQALASTSQFEAYIPSVVTHLGLDTNVVKEALRNPHRLPFRSVPGWDDSVEVFPLEWDQRPSALAGVMRIRAGGILHDHEHVGEERLVVLQGRCVDTFSGKEISSPKQGIGPDGHRHGFRVLPGPDMLYVFTVQNALKRLDNGARLDRDAVPASE